MYLLQARTHTSTHTPTPIDTQCMQPHGWPKQVYVVYHVKLNSYLNAKHVFITFSHANFHFWDPEHLSDQNVIPTAMLFHELKEVQLQERFMLMTHGHLKTLCMSVLSLSGGLSSLNGNTTGHRSKSWKMLASWYWIQLPALSLVYFKKVEMAIT